MNLYQIAEEYILIFSDLENAGFDEQTISDTMESVSGDFDEKAISVAAYIENLRAEAAAVSVAAERMLARKKSIEKKIANLISYLVSAMEKTGRKEISGIELVLKLKKNPPALIVDDEDSIPDEFFDEIPATVRINKAAIKSAIQAGEEVNGAHIEQATRVEIK